jgi:hypothetical protein
MPSILASLRSTFAADLHQKIAEAGLKSGDEFKISKVAVQNGRKVTARVDFEVVAKELPRIVYHVLKNKTEYRGLKGQPISHQKAN